MRTFYIFLPRWETQGHEYGKNVLSQNATKKKHKVFKKLQKINIWTRCIFLSIIASCGVGNSPEKLNVLVKSVVLDIFLRERVYSRFTIPVFRRKADFHSLHSCCAVSTGLPSWHSFRSVALLTPANQNRKTGKIYK